MIGSNPGYFLKKDSTLRETVVKVQLQPLKYLIAWVIFGKNAGIGNINLHDYLEYMLWFQKNS